MQNAVLITGANSGIGRESARQLAVHGNYSAIYLACRNRVKAQRARSELQALTGYTRFITVDFDAANPESAQRLVRPSIILSMVSCSTPEAPEATCRFNGPIQA